MTTGTFTSTFFLTSWMPKIAFKDLCGPRASSSFFFLSSSALAASISSKFGLLSIVGS